MRTNDEKPIGGTALDRPAASGGAKSMFVLIGSAHERHGGAAVAASRLCTGLLSQGVRADLFVQHQDTRAPYVRGPSTPWQRVWNRARSQVDALPLRAYPRRSADFSVNWLPRSAPAWPKQPEPDLVHLHWINAGFLSVADLPRLGRPLVWTMHDMWAMTGGCHYDADCGRFSEGCGACPQLGSRSRHDLSRRRFRAKQAAVLQARPTVIAPSRWMADSLRRSPVFADRRIEVIRNGIDIDKFRPLHRAFAREVLGLPPLGHRLVLFGALNAASDSRKGFDLLDEALRRLSAMLQAENRDTARAAENDTTLVVFGSTHPHEEQRHGLRVIHVGHLNDETSLALLYSACDVFVAPSRQENLPNTVAEALACGTPCVAFHVGGLTDLIEHERHGYLARAFETDDLAHGIAWVLADESRLESLRQAARQFALAHLDSRQQTRRHIDLYADILGSAGGSPT